MDIELAEPVHTLKFPEAIEWHFAGTSDKLKELGTFFLVKGTNGSPEPLDLRRRGGVVVVLGIVLPVVDVDIRETGDE